MENVENINKKIILITLEINERFPELLNFLNEMPVSIPNLVHPKINIKSLTSYYQSLVSLKENYIQQLNLKHQKHD